MPWKILNTYNNNRILLETWKGIGIFLSMCYAHNQMNCTLRFACSCWIKFRTKKIPHQPIYSSPKKRTKERAIHIYIEHTYNTAGKNWRTTTVEDSQNHQIVYQLNQIFWWQTKFRFGLRELRNVRKATSEVFPPSILVGQNFWALIGPI